MPSDRWDVIVVGLGAMGSAALYQLSKRGVRVLGIDQFSPPHDRGSSHGDTRLTRLGVGEGAHYVPLAMRSHEIWRELEAASGEEILSETGGFFFSGEEQVSPVHGASDFITATIAAAEQFGIEHEVLDVEAMRSRFPQFKYYGKEVGYYEPRAGFVCPERAIDVQLRLAESQGATVWRNTPVTAVEPEDGSVRVVTDRGAQTATRVVLTAGAWISRFLEPQYSDRFAVYRQMLFWFDVDGSIDDFMPGRFPVYIRTDRTKDDVLYGFPAVDGPNGGIKIASEQYLAQCDPDRMDRDVSDEEVAQMHALASRFLRIGQCCQRATSCLFTVTPDGEFVIDFHPRHSELILASPCSGHGFKHSAAIGEMLAELAIDGETRFERGPFVFTQ